MTSCSDTLYGGGGITPSIFIPIDTSVSQQKANRLTFAANINNFVYNYYLQNKLQVDKYNATTDFIAGFNNTENMWNELVKFTANDSANFKSVGGKEKELIQQRLKALLARYKWRNAGFYQVLNSNDAMVKKAMDITSK